MPMSRPDGTATDPSTGVVRMTAGKGLNGLGMMVIQYLEQDFAEFPDKASAASRIRCRIGMEVEKGIAVTISFRGSEVVVENGVGCDLDLHIRAPYRLLAQVLCAQARPLVEVLRGRIRVHGFPSRPVQLVKVLRLLKLRPEPRAESRASTDA